MVPLPGGTRNGVYPLLLWVGKLHTQSRNDEAKITSRVVVLVVYGKWAKKEANVIS